MNKYYVDENNSGGYTVALGVLSDPRPHWVEIEAETSQEAIEKFEEHFNLVWSYENSYEGNSCNCCGRRFTLYTPIKSEDSGWDLMQIEYYEKEPYFIKSYHGCKLNEAPTKK